MMDKKPDIIHRLITGQTLSGKSTLAKTIAKEAHEGGFLIALYDPIGDDWGITPDYYGVDSQFFIGLESWAKKQNKEYPILLIIDEAMECMGVGDKQNHWVATRGRHYLFHCVFIAVRPVLVAPTIRNQCAEAMAFHISEDDARLMAGDHGEGMRDAATLRQGEYLYAHWEDGEKVVDKFSAFD